MTVYNRPGVYLTETLTPLSQAVTTPGSSVAAFVGEFKGGGPLVPTLISSFSQFVSIYGGFGDCSDLLPFAVYEFFNNGGSACYVVRAASSDATAASVTLMDTETTPEGTLKISAISPGSWGNQVYVDISSSTSGGGRFDMVVYVGGSTSTFAREQFNDVSLDPSDSRNAQALINSPVTGSSYIQIESLITTAWASTHSPALQTGVALTGGTDGTATVDLVAATETLEVITDNLLVNLPGISDPTTINSLITWAEGVGNVFLIVDGAQALASDNAASYAVSLQSMATGSTALTASSYVAIYAPWLIFNDPATLTNGSARLLPPGGAVMGQYALTDAASGVQKPAAGIDTSLKGVLDTQFRFTNTELGSLNDAGVNAIKPYPGSGFVIFGDRTLSAGMPDRYVSVRRALMAVEQGCNAAVAFAAFEPNDSILWSQISAQLTQYLTTQMQNGLLAGSTPDEAFFIVCDDTNNTATSIQNAQVNIQVGVAVLYPAEFVVLNVGLYSGTSSTSTS